MIQQSIAQFTRNAQKATSIVDDDKLPDRQRGMWSFLTWSFFLAQAVAAHEAFAKGHAGADAGLDADGSDSSNGDDAAQKGLPSASMLGASGFDVDPAAAAQFAAAIAAGLVTPQMLAGFQADPALFQAFVDQLTGNASAAFGDVAAATGSAEDLTAAATGEGDGGSHEGPIHGPDLGDVISGIPPGILDDLGLIPDAVFDHILDPLVGTVSHLLDGTLDAAEHVVTGALHALPDFLNDTIDIVKAPVDKVLGLLGSDGLDNATEPLIQITTQATGIAAHAASNLIGVVGDGGNMLFGAVNSLSAVLSTSGAYKNYDVEVASGSSDTPDTADIGNTIDAVASAAIDVVDDGLKALLHGISSDYHG